uniref:Unannotated protein n=1 Tax=freshwater metagenome TaxID=449393 RepID=A0A6J5Z3W5_9ZZZZ
MTPHFSVSLLGTQSDERLSSLAGAGHERAFEAIVERYRKPLSRYATRFVGEARAEEVVQTAFLSAWSALSSGTEVRDLRPWLYRIVHNGALNAMHRAETNDSELIEAADGAMGPDAIFEQSEAVREALGMIADLPERQRAALLAVAVDGRAHSDVALDLGVSDAGVRQLVRRARVQLRTAATALTPLPLAMWLANGQRGAAAHADLTHRVAEMLGDGGGTALASRAVKAGAVVVSITAVAAAAPEVGHVINHSSGSQRARAAVAVEPGNGTAVGLGGPAGVVLAARPTDSAGGKRFVFGAAPRGSQGSPGGAQRPPQTGTSGDDGQGAADQMPGTGTGRGGGSGSGSGSGSGRRDGGLGGGLGGGGRNRGGSGGGRGNQGGSDDSGDNVTSSPSNPSTGGGGGRNGGGTGRGRNAGGKGNGGGRNGGGQATGGNGGGKGNGGGRNGGVRNGGGKGGVGAQDFSGDDYSGD